MATKSAPSKKSQRRKERSRPVSTAALSEPILAESSSAASFTAFSPSGLLFAHVALAVDKHRLRIFDSETAKATAESVFQNARVSAIHWTLVSTGTNASDAVTDADEGDDSSRKKKKRKRKSAQKDESGVSSEECLILGFSNGTLGVFSPRQGEIIRTLSSPTVTASILSITTSSSSPNSTLWTSTANGSILAWDLATGQLTSTIRAGSSTTPYSALSIRPSSSHILAAHHRISVLDTHSEKTRAAFTGHASPVLALDWAPSSSTSQSTTFLSAAEGDRFVSVWKLPEIEDDEDEDEDSDDEEDTPEGTLIASIALDADVRSAGYLPSSSDSPSSPSFAYALSVSGALKIFVPPTEASSNKKGTTPITSVSSVDVKSPANSPAVVAVAFDKQKVGSMRIARVIAGVRPVFNKVDFLTADGTFLSEIKLKAPPKDQAGLEGSDKVLSTKRYKETNEIIVRSGAEQTLASGIDSTQDGALDTSLAELSLGQRLAASSSASTKSTSGLSGTTIAPSEGNLPAGDVIFRSDAPTLTRTLTQALHSHDTALLERVLQNSNRALISGTVARLQPQYALPLINACVERMNRTPGAGQGKGSSGAGAGASPARTEQMVRWIRAVLVAHSAYLMSVPDLVSRLAALHTTVVRRTSMQERLLSLGGKLDLVLAQMEFRAETMARMPKAAAEPTAGAQSRRKRKKKAAAGTTDARAVGTKYVEGESTDEDEDENAMDVDDDDDEDDEDSAVDDYDDIDEAEDAGSIEDIELGSEEEAFSGSAEEGDEDDEEDDSEDGAAGVNGFIDLEAAESSGEGDSGSDESDDE